MIININGITMKKILVPTDFSEEASYAYGFAHQLAQKSKSDLSLMNVIEYPTGSSFNSMGIRGNHDPMENIYIMKLMEATKGKMEELVASKDFTGITADYKITMGNPYRQIEEELGENPADLIIMGSRGATGAKETFLGSNAEKMIRNSSVPVLTLHASTDINDVKDIVFASDFEEEDSEIATHLSTLQEFFDAKLHLVKVNTPAYFAPTRYDKQRIEKFIEKYGLKNCTINIYNDEQEEIGIRHFAQDIDADLIAMATHGRKGFGHLLLGSVAEDVANRTSKPVWTFKID